MSRTASDHLHQLIHSLTPAEKRHFKLFASRHTEDNKYVQLFDAIVLQKKYDEKFILEKFRKELFVKKFSIAKTRLYHSILRSLDIFNSSSSLDAELKRELHFAEILYKKSLYDQCAKVLTSAKKYASKYERNSLLLEIYQWEKKLIEKDNYSGKTQQDINRFLEEDKLIAERIKNFSDYWNIKSRLFMILNKSGKARTKEELQNFKQIIDNTLLKAESEALSVETKYLYHHIYSAYFFGTGDYNKCCEHLQKNIELIENNKHIFEEEPNIYFSVLTNLIYISSQLKKYNEAFSCLKKLRLVPREFDISKNEDLQIKLFSSSFSIEITLYNTLGDFEKAMELIPHIEEGLEKFSGKINKLREAYFYSSMGVACFGAEKYSTALRWVNKILNDREIEEHQDIHCFAKIFSLIIQIELKQKDMLPHTFKSTHRYLSKRKRVYKFESVMLRFVEQLMKGKTTTSEKNNYGKLFSELEPLENDAFEQPVFEFFDFTSWAKSKAENWYFRQIVEEKAK